MSEQPKELIDIIIEVLPLLEYAEKLQLTKFMNSRAKTNVGIADRMIKLGFTTTHKKANWAFAIRILKWAGIDTTRAENMRKEAIAARKQRKMDNEWKEYQ